MNVFIPYRDFHKCAKCLDMKRLYKQIVEIKQLLQVIDKRNYYIRIIPDIIDKLTGKIDVKKIKSYNKFGDLSWINHPATIMWQNYPETLRYYQSILLKEWMFRRWDLEVDAVYDHTKYDVMEYNYNMMPKFMDNEELHKSHRLNLLFKDPMHYRVHFEEKIPEEKPEYIWIIEQNKNE